MGLIGGVRFRVPRRVARLIGSIRDLAVFALVFMALIRLQPETVTYEPFSALFSLTGTTLQWLLLAGVLVASLFLASPWCTHMCPMFSVERLLHALVGKGGGDGPGGQRSPVTLRPVPAPTIDRRDFQRRDEE